MLILMKLFDITDLKAIYHSKEEASFKTHSGLTTGRELGCPPPQKKKNINIIVSAKTLLQTLEFTTEPRTLLLLCILTSFQLLVVKHNIFCIKFFIFLSHSIIVKLRFYFC